MVKNEDKSEQQQAVISHPSKSSPLTAWPLDKRRSHRIVLPNENVQEGKFLFPLIRFRKIQAYKREKTQAKIEPEPGIQKKGKMGLRRNLLRDAGETRAPYDGPRVRRERAHRNRGGRPKKNPRAEHRQVEIEFEILPSTKEDV